MWVDGFPVKLTAREASSAMNTRNTFNFKVPNSTTTEISGLMVDVEDAHLQDVLVGSAGLGLRLALGLREVLPEPLDCGEGEPAVAVWAREQVRPRGDTFCHDGVLGPC